MILVTGAAGKTGRAVIGALAARGAAIRALARRPDHDDALMALGAREIVHGSMGEKAAVRTALSGCRAVYHIAPNVDAQEEAYGEVLLNAALAEGVEHVVYHSVLHPQIEAMPHHWAKMRVEEMIFASKQPFTILQPTAYMQNLLQVLDRARDNGLLLMPYPVETRISLVDLADVGEVAARVLTEDGHQGATYELAGTPPLSQTEVAAILSGVLGREVRAQEQSVSDWGLVAAQSGVPFHARATLASMFRAYARQGLTGNSNVLRWLLGREPTSLETMLRRSLAE